MPWEKPYHPPHNQRLALELYSRAHHVFFMTLRAFNRLSPFVEKALNSDILDVLHEEQGRQQCAVFTYCLMPDHLHFLISARIDGVSVLRFVDQFKGKSTNRSWKLGRQGKLWQPRYYDHVVRREENLRQIARYILENPVRKGLCVLPEDWPWGGQMNAFP